MYVDNIYIFFGEIEGSLGYNFCLFFALLLERGWVNGRRRGSRIMIFLDLGMVDDLVFERCNRYRKIVILFMGKEIGFN